MSLSGGGLDQIELTTLVETRIEDRLTKLPGVAQLYCTSWESAAWRSASGSITTASPARGLVRSRTSPRLCEQSNVDIPSGRVESLDQEFSVRTPGELHTAEEATTPS